MRDGVTPAAGQRVRAPQTKPGEPRRVGRYDLLFEIARGGMGAVWVARLRGADGFGRFVAVKAMQKTESDEAFVQFREEAKVAARIHHPNVVQTLELFEHEGEPFMVMDLVQGVSLSRLQERLLETREALPPEVAAWIVMQVASGLHVAHELTDREGKPLGLVHRDVSPQNILLSYDGRAYIADFGVAKFNRESFATQSGVLKGKFAYMSPEQARAKEIDRRSDVFALGIVLHEALTGERLYPAEHAADALIRIVSVAPPEAHRVRAGVPLELSTIASKCLEKKPEDRYATANELRDALRAALQKLGAVDEQRLAEILARFFKRDEEALKKRLAALDGEGAEDPGLATTLPVEDAVSTTVRASRPPVTLEVASGARVIEPAITERMEGVTPAVAPAAPPLVPAPAPRKRSLAIVVVPLLVLLLAGVGVSYALKHRAAPSPVAASTEASAPSSTPPPLSASSLVSEPASTVAPTASHANAIDPKSKPAGTAVATPPPRPRGTGRGASPPSPTNATTAAPAQPAPAASFKGKPFDDL